MLPTLALVTSLLAGQAAALPYFYSMRHNGCEIPSQPYGAHLAPKPAEGSAVTLEYLIENEQGQAVTSWEPGAQYMVTVTCAGTDGASPCNLWVHTTIGTLEPSGEGMMQGATCPELSIFSVGPNPESGEAAGIDGRAASHTFMWTAPEDGSVAQTTVSLAAAFGGSSPYWTAEATFPWEAATGQGPGTAPLAEGPGVPDPVENPAAASPTDSAVGFLGAMVAAICVLGAFVAV